MSRPGSERPQTRRVETVVERRAVPDGAVSFARLQELRAEVERSFLDVRLWEALTEPEREAAERLYLAAALLSRGVGLRANRLDLPRVDGGRGGEADFDRPVVRDYFAWRRRADDEGLDTGAVLAVVAGGASLSAVDRERRRRKGYARRSLLAGLALYCRLKGWPSAPYGKA